MKKKRNLKSKTIDMLVAQPARKHFFTSKMANFIFIVMLFSTVMLCMPVWAADPLVTAKGLLSKAATVGGGLWAVWGLVQLGMTIKEHNGPGIQGAIWQIIGGGIIVAAGAAINGLDLSFAAP